MSKQEWAANDLEHAQHLGVIEFQDAVGEYHNFEVFLTEGAHRLVFGGFCNVGLLESGYMVVDDCFSVDENLQELVADLECYYSDGPAYVSRIVYNERM